MPLCSWRFGHLKYPGARICKLAENQESSLFPYVAGDLESLDLASSAAIKNQMGYSVQRRERAKAAWLALAIAS